VKTAMLIKDGVPLVSTVLCAGGFVARLIGLLGRRGLGSDRAMYLTPCGGIHSCFMRFELDLIFVDADLRVVRIVRKVKPWRCVSGGRGARGVIELEAGWLADDAVAVKDQLRLDYLRRLE